MAKILRARRVTPEQATALPWVLIADTPTLGVGSVRQNAFPVVLEFYDTETRTTTPVGLTSGED